MSVICNLRIKENSQSEFGKQAKKINVSASSVGYRLYGSVCRSFILKLSHVFIISIFGTYFKVVMDPVAPMSILLPTLPVVLYRPLLLYPIRIIPVKVVRLTAEWLMGNRVHVMPTSDGVWFPISALCKAVFVSCGSASPWFVPDVSCISRVELLLP